MTRERIQSLDKLGFKWELNSKSCTWEERRKQLADFKKQFLHTNVLHNYEENKPFVNWVNTQRTQHKLFKASKTSYMTREQMQSLDKLGFEWELNYKSWEERRKQLAVFKTKFLHTNVPRDYAENKPFASWVNTQRIQYKLFEASKKSHMTRERIQSLDKLDFEWVQSKSWESKLQELADFKKNCLHTNVPRSNKSLGKWVNTQRTQYKLFKASKTSHMTRERIQSLHKLDFEWVQSKSWESKLQELADFKKNCLHMNVPRSNKSLERWVNAQRTQCKLFKASKTSHMTRERIQSLDKLGFEWSKSK